MASMGLEGFTVATRWNASLSHGRSSRAARLETELVRQRHIHALELRMKLADRWNKHDRRLSKAPKLSVIIDGSSWTDTGDLDVTR